MLIAIALAFLSGGTRTVSRMVNAMLAAKTNALTSTLYNYILGLLCSMIALLVSRGPLSLSTLTVGHIPAWAYLGGLVGVLFVALSNITTPKISAFSMTLLIFIGQVATGIAVDTFINERFSLGKTVGGVSILAGLACNLYIDKAAKRTHS